MFGLMEASAKRRAVGGGRSNSAAAERVAGEGIHLHHPKAFEPAVAGCGASGPRSG